MQRLKPYRYPMIGGIVGFTLALLLLTLGILKTLLLFIFVTIGVGAGWYVQETGLLDSLLKQRN